jgi:hypothetical protein
MDICSQQYRIKIHKSYHRSDIRYPMMISWPNTVKIDKDGTSFLFIVKKYSYNIINIQKSI